MDPLIVLALLLGVPGVLFLGTALNTHNTLGFSNRLQLFSPCHRALEMDFVPASLASQSTHVMVPMIKRTSAL